MTREYPYKPDGVSKQELRELIEEWRQTEVTESIIKYSEFYKGIDDAQNECADELEALLDE